MNLQNAFLASPTRQPSTTEMAYEQIECTSVKCDKCENCSCVTCSCSGKIFNPNTSLCENGKVLFITFVSSQGLLSH